MEDSTNKTTGLQWSSEVVLRTESHENESNVVFVVLGNTYPLATNSIRTSKYTPLSFLPLNLFHQLTKIANIYFIIICCLQMIKPISISGGVPTNAPPLLFVIFVSMLKTGLRTE